MNASSEENSRNFNNLALEMEGNIFFNENYNEETDYILKNVKLEQVNFRKAYKIYINTSYEGNKLITNIDNKNKTISFIYYVMTMIILKKFYLIYIICISLKNILIILCHVRDKLIL